MTRFIDGPAKGATLFLSRAPHFLRVVQGPDGPTTAGDIDPLDQLDDTPRSTERVTAYEMVSGPRHMHVNRGRNGCGWYRGGDYRMVVEQPDDATMRNTGLWRAWCSALIGRPIGEDGQIHESAHGNR